MYLCIVKDNSSAFQFDAFASFDLTERLLQNNCIYSKIIALLKSTTVNLAVEQWFSQGAGWEYLATEHCAMKNCTKVMN